MTSLGSLSTLRGDAERNKRRIEKMRGIRFFWFAVLKKPVTPPALTKGKIPLLLSACVRIFLVVGFLSDAVFPRRMDQEPLVANPDGHRLVV